MSKNKKPTMNQVKDAINYIIGVLSDQQTQLNQNDSVTASYIEFNKDGKKFNKFLKEKIEKSKKEKGKDDRSSVKSSS